MRRHRRFALGLVAIAAAAVACTGGGSGGGGDPAGNGDLTSGEYEVSGSFVDEDGCAVMSALDGRVIDVVVAGSSLTWDGASGSIEDGVFEAQVIQPLDFNEDPFLEGPLDCVVERKLSWSGVTTIDDEADVEYEFAIDEGEGTQCAEAAAQASEVVGTAIEFPCDSFAGYHVTRLPDPVVFAGTITLLATNGLLTNDATTASDSGFTMTGTLDGMGPFSEPTEAWSCFVPSPPTFPNYDLYIGSDYVITLSITTASWAVGSVPVSALNEASLVGPGFAATITGGTLEILGAPAVVGSSYRCAVSLSNAPFTNQP